MAGRAPLLARVGHVLPLYKQQNVPKFKLFSSHRQSCLDSIWDVFLGKIFCGIYPALESKFLENKTVDLKEYMFSIIPRY